VKHSCNYQNYLLIAIVLLIGFAHVWFDVDRDGIGALAFFRRLFNWLSVLSLVNVYLGGWLTKVSMFLGTNLEDTIGVFSCGLELSVGGIGMMSFGSFGNPLECSQGGVG
jgi:hypothetical protein